MAKKLGDNLRLFVKDATGDTFSQPLGQGSLTINRSAASIDLSDKNTGQYGASAPGQKTLTLSQAFQPNLPDTAYTRMKALDASSATVVYQVREAPFATADVQFECLMYTSFGNTDAPQKGAVATSVTLSAADAPTVDKI